MPPPSTIATAAMAATAPTTRPPTTHAPCHHTLPCPPGLVWGNCLLLPGCEEAHHVCPPSGSPPTPSPRPRTRRPTAHHHLLLPLDPHTGPTLLPLPPPPATTPGVCGGTVYSSCAAGAPPTLSLVGGTPSPRVPGPTAHHAHTPDPHTHPTLPPCPPPAAKLSPPPGACVEELCPAAVLHLHLPSWPWWLAPPPPDTTSRRPPPPPGPTNPPHSAPPATMPSPPPGASVGVPSSTAVLQLQLPPWPWWVAHPPPGPDVPPPTTSPQTHTPTPLCPPCHHALSTPRS